MINRYGGYEWLEFVAEFYDAVYEKSASGDVGLYIDYARQQGGRTLELGCGTGRVLIPMAIAGHAITGLDISPYMLSVCREKLAQQPEAVQKRVRLIEGNMNDFDTGETYTLITIPFRAFQHLISVEEQKKCLNCAYRHLALGGLLVIDVFNPDLPRLHNPIYLQEKDMGEAFKLPDGRVVRPADRITAFHQEQQYNDVELIFYVSYLDGRQERLVQSFPMRYFFHYELEHLLELCGFTVIDLFGNFDRSPYTANSPEIIFVARRR